MNKFDQVVFIVEVADGGFDGRFIEETTTPRGVGPTYHVRENELWTWGHQGNASRLIRAYDSEAEAVVALEETFAHDFWNASEILAFNNRADAEAYIREQSE